MDICLVHHDGELVRHQKMTAAPAPFLQAVAPSRDGLVGAVAGLCTWSWRADLGPPAGLPLVWGQALSLQALHGGTAQNDPRDSPQLAAVLRGGRLPQADGSRAERRATRARLRRRTPLRRQRAARFAQGHNPTSHYHFPESGQQSADTATRTGGAERVDEAAGPQPRDVALALRTSDAERRTDRALSRLPTATPPAATPLSLGHPLPGLGHILRLVRRYAIHASRRFPRGQEVASDARWVQGRQASGGKRWGTAGQKSGQAPRTGAFSAAAWFLRPPPAGQQRLPRWEKQPAQGTALSRLAHPRGRAVSGRRPRHTACEMPRCLRSSGRSAAEPGASLAAAGLRRKRARARANVTASVTAKACRGPVALRPGACWAPRSGS
jgi:hypothetical protein